MYYGYINEPTIILEVVAFIIFEYDTFFGLPRSHNDINMLKKVLHIF